MWPAGGGAASNHTVISFTVHTMPCSVLPCHTMPANSLSFKLKTLLSKCVLSVNVYSMNKCVKYGRREQKKERSTSDNCIFVDSNRKPVQARLFLVTTRF